MKKAALVFMLTVFVPSLLLAWMAIRSVQDQQFVAERQRTLLAQAATDELARQIDDVIKSQQRQFGEEVESLAADRPIDKCARDFDRRPDGNRSHARDTVLQGKCRFSADSAAGGQTHVRRTYR